MTNRDVLCEEIDKLRKAAIVHDCLTEELPYNPVFRGTLPPRGPPIPRADFEEGLQTLSELQNRNVE